MTCRTLRSPVPKLFFLFFLSISFLFVCVTSLELPRHFQLARLLMGTTLLLSISSFFFFFFFMVNIYYFNDTGSHQCHIPTLLGFFFLSIPYPLKGHEIGVQIHIHTHTPYTVYTNIYACI